MGKLRKILKPLWIVQTLLATFFAIKDFYLWYWTTPRGQIPFYSDWIAGLLGIGLFIDWIIAIFG